MPPAGMTTQHLHLLPEEVGEADFMHDDYDSLDPSSSSSSPRAPTSYAPPSPRTKATESVAEGENFASASAREQAYSILDSWEKLAWYANARDESIPQTRLYFTKILHGINPETPEPLLTDAKYGDVLPAALAVGAPSTAAAASGRSTGSKGGGRGGDSRVLGTRSSRRDGRKSPRGAGAGAGGGRGGGGASVSSSSKAKRKSEGRG